ncbi:hypothetical protein GOBAR_DD27262 [Gossypium barbadense]|nr:hypothetical protein GOBAR_DD27262 [Gossypium barbadense]
MARGSSSKPPPPPPSHPKTSAWDFLNPFESYENYNHPYTPSRDLREVREAEGIPNLEDENYQHENLLLFSFVEYAKSWGFSWWGCPPSKFPWTYSSKETCYLLEGKVKVYPDGSNDFVEIGAGDLVEFPKGMSCTWEVSVAVDKHYKFE